MRSDEREDLRRRLDELEDDELVFTLLGVHRGIESQARGHQRELLKTETLVITNISSGSSTLSHSTRRWCAGKAASRWSGD